LDDVRTREAEQRVQAWREGNELPFPEFPEALVEQIEDTVDYPPAGSASLSDPSTQR